MHTKGNWNESHNNLTANTRHSNFDIIYPFLLTKAKHQLCRNLVSFLFKNMKESPTLQDEISIHRRLRFSFLLVKWWDFGYDKKKVKESIWIWIIGNSATLPDLKRVKCGCSASNRCRNRCWLDKYQPICACHRWVSSAAVVEKGREVKDASYVKRNKKLPHLI